MTADELYMSRCLELASNGLGNVAPNPLVGCVIVHDGKIIGEGFHQHFGQAHAEVNAINEAIQKHGADILKQSHLYVSLEPCSHFGKTPPCADLIIEKNIPKVTIGCSDTYAEVNGQGIKKLKAAGIEVHKGILEKECREINKRFFTFHEKKRPYIILKWAQSIDQFIAPANATEENRKISNAYSHKHSHKWRSEEQAILVGANTVKTDNPLLTVREWTGRNPIRIIIDPENTIEANANVLNNDAPTLVFSGTINLKTEVNEWIEIDLKKNTLDSILTELYKRNIQSVIVEGGRITLEHFIDQNLWDEARIFIAAKFLNAGIKAPQINFSKKIHEENILDDKLYFLRNQ